MLLKILMESSNIQRLRMLPSSIQLARMSASTGGKDERKTKAVIFDMGGVIIPSPLGFFRDFESSLGLSSGSLSKAIITAGPNGAWQRLERGEISVEEFGKQMSEEYSKMTGSRADLTTLFDKFMKIFHVDVKPYPQMINTIKNLRAEGFKTALLTNNFKIPSHYKDQKLRFDTNLFDVEAWEPCISWLKESKLSENKKLRNFINKLIIVESAKQGMRKPEARIYHYTLEQLKVKPEQAVFLDDLGENLKGAQEIGIRTIKVSDPDKAISDLEKELGVSLKDYIEGTTSVPDRLKIPVDKLKDYLTTTLNISSKDVADPIVRCFEHGQSNPTYFVHFAGRDMVLRKKPPGKLLPSAHAVEREYRVMKALQNQNVPVPNMISLCEDSSILGTPFYLMDHIKGRVFKDPSLPGMSKEERVAIYRAMCEVLVKIHNVDISKANLDDYGKKGEFIKRNFGRWAKQYEASKAEDHEEMTKLMEWLNKNMPTNEQCTIVHGDFRLDNLIYHPTEPVVLAVIDWELSTLGDPLTDLATNCLIYYLPRRFSTILPALDPKQMSELGLPTVENYLRDYAQQRGLKSVGNWNYYVAFVLFRMSAILHGVYKRYTQVDNFTVGPKLPAIHYFSPLCRFIGQAASSSAGSVLEIAKAGANLGWKIASGTGSGIGSSPSGDQRRNYSTHASSNMTSKSYSTSHSSTPAGTLILSVSGLSPKVQDIHKKVKTFITENVLPLEKEFHDWSSDPKTKWTINPKMEQLKEKAKSQGLWNLFLPKESDPDLKYSPGLTNLEYAFLAEEMGKSMIASEAFNCSAPDTGNMEVLVRYGTEEQKERWLKPLLNGTIRSCFGMTEPAVASSDATNIQASIVREGDSYVINGHKWWTSGAMDPRTKLCIFMGKTNPSGPTHSQQSMIIVPMDAPGVKIVRPLTLFGYDDAAHGHAEVLFENVRVPASNILLGEGRGFEIAQGRLGPGRIHHCMRLIGSAERSLQIMVDRVQNRIAFGKPLISYNSIQQDIARSRIEIEQCRLIVLKAAHLMDTVGNKKSAPEIAMIKVAVPSTVCGIIDRAMQAHGGMGVCQDTPLAHFYAQARMLRIADGPDEVHMRSICRMEASAQNKAKL